jgi:hypothetical protein
VPNFTCATYSANGGVGQECSTVASDAFPDGSGHNLTCDCSQGATANNTCVGSSALSAGTCRDLEWARWPVPPSAPPDSQYSWTNDTVTDDETKLVWQRNVPSGAYTWDAAKTHCRSLTLGGFSSGWRLPTRVELVTIVDFTRYNPAINFAAFPDTPSSSFWSSSPHAYFSGDAWWVDFFVGVSVHSPVSLGFHVRCVR